ncbi:hypothetical protein T02_4425 [Trichinella nativa]|uniref:Uncharacterized protein n=2 Tax=Trichinella TaxID=6333 RepID=A0A0V1LIN3_9BILA|nr:hypothetical protein T05_5122 [Trichinella murrelli]KRZ59385.1 hypothetical protein T02_4425 [Trichinella nativa]
MYLYILLSNYDKNLLVILRYLYVVRYMIALLAQTFIFELLATGCKISFRLSICILFTQHSVSIEASLTSCRDWLPPDGWIKLLQLDDYCAALNTSLTKYKILSGEKGKANASCVVEAGVCRII